MAKTDDETRAGGPSSCGGSAWTIRSWPARSRKGVGPGFHLRNFPTGFLCPAARDLSHEEKPSRRPGFRGPSGTISGRASRREELRSQDDTQRILIQDRGRGSPWKWKRCWPKGFLTVIRHSPHPSQDSGRACSGLKRSDLHVLRHLSDDRGDHAGTRAARPQDRPAPVPEQGPGLGHREPGARHHPGQCQGNSLGFGATRPKMLQRRLLEQPAQDVRRPWRWKCSSTARWPPATESAWVERISTPRPLQHGRRSRERISQVGPHRPGPSARIFGHKSPNDGQAGDHCP